MRPALLALSFLTGASLVAAPVPKQAAPQKPAKLTAEMLVGQWSYSWASCPNGWIDLTADGNYTAQHSPGSTTVYSGTWSVGEGSITLVEWSRDTVTGNVSGPRCYRFDVGMGEWPAVAGHSTGGFGFDVQEIPAATMAVKLHGKK